MGEARTVAIFGVATVAGDGLCRTCSGHHQEVQQVGATGTAQVRVAEAADVFVGNVVARAMVPAGLVVAIIEGVGAQLHHSERHRGAGVSVSVASRADLDLDVIRYVGVRGRARARSQDLGSHILQQSHCSRNRRSSAKKYTSGNHFICPWTLFLEWTTGSCQPHRAKPESICPVKGCAGSPLPGGRVDLRAMLSRYIYSGFAVRAGRRLPR